MRPVGRDWCSCEFQGPHGLWDVPSGVPMAAGPGSLQVGGSPGESAGSLRI